MTSYRAGVILRAANILMFSLWLYRMSLGGIGGADIYVFAGMGVYLLANAAQASLRREISPRREAAYLAADVAALSLAVVVTKSWISEVHLAFLAPVILASLRLSPRLAASIALFSSACILGLGALTQLPLPAIFTYRAATLLMAALAAHLFSAASLHRSSGEVHAALGQQRGLLFNEFINHLLFQVREYLTSIATIVEHIAFTAKEPGLKDLADKLKRSMAELNGKLGRMMDALKNNTTTRGRVLLASVETGTLVRRCLENAQAAAGETSAEVRRSIDPAIGAIQCDAAIIHTIVTAVITNALEAVLPLGPNGLVEITTEDAGDAARLSVVDNGGPISADALQNAFSPLVTTKSAIGGMGLGLSMSRRMLERTGGTILIRSDGARTTVRLDIPKKPSLPVIRNEESTWAGRRSQK